MTDAPRSRDADDLDALTESGELRPLARAMAKLLAAWWLSLDPADRDPDPPPETNAARSTDRARTGA